MAFDLLLGLLRGEAVQCQGALHPTTLRMIVLDAEGATPTMAQWFAIKADHPNALVFLRMGDFFELFFEDAEAAAAALDITLTHRGEHGGKPIPMC